MPGRCRAIPWVLGSTRGNDDEECLCACGTRTDSRSAFSLNGDFRLMTLPVQVRKAVLSYFVLQPPHDGKRVSTFAGADESLLFQRLDRIAIGRQRANFFVIFRPQQDWVAA